MELNGDTNADRWEQISVIASDLSQKIATEKATIHTMLATLEQTEKNLEKLAKDLGQLSGLAYKEVLREESGTLNDEASEFENEPVPDFKTPEFKTPEPQASSTVSPKQTALPLDIKE